jgi:hypothetical protein
MSNAERLGMIRLQDLSNPLTWRFNLATTWGITSQTITLDVPDLFDRPAESLEFGRRMWAGFIATAISSRCSLSFIELVRWKQTPLPLLGSGGGAAGKAGRSASTRENSGVAILHTDTGDQYSRNRLYIPNIPATWAVDGSLTDAGMANLYDWSSILFMGMARACLPGPLLWLTYYPDIDPFSPDNVRGVAFRPVEFIRICSYVDKAPDEVSLDWP